MSNVQPSERKSCSKWRRSYSKRMAKRATYREIAKSYVSYVHPHYGHSCITFDGYKQDDGVENKRSYY